MPTYRANVASGTASGSGVIIYGEEAAVVSPAAANDCPSGWSCLWAHAGFGGRMLQFHDPGPWQNLDQYSFNNDASSIYNRKAGKSTFYSSDPSGSGSLLCRRAGESTSTLNSFWDNNITSILISTLNNC